MRRGISPGKLFAGCFLLMLDISLSLFGADTRVQVSNYQFNPPKVEIHLGDSVTWVNIDGGHNVHGSLFANSIASAPWEYSYTFTTAGNFPYVCDRHAPFMSGSVLARDSNGPPQISFAAPLPGSTFAANDAVTLTATATDDVAVAKLEFTENGISLGSRPSPPYSITLMLPPGNHSITARATDDVNATAEASTELTVLENHRPAIAIAEPQPGQITYLPGPLNIRVEVADAEGADIAKIVFHMDDKPFATNLQSLTLTVTNNLAPGAHEFTAAVTDAGGLSRTSVPVLIFVSPAPTLSVNREPDGSLSLLTGSVFGFVTFQSSPSMAPGSWVDLESGSPGGGQVGMGGIHPTSSHVYFRLIVK